MKQKHGHDSIGNLLMQVCKVRRSLSNERLAKLDLHDGQDILLYYLHTEDGQTVSELVEKMCIQHATISSMIDRMVAKGIITKEKDEVDLRVSRVFLTSKGKEAVKGVVDIWIDLEKKSMDGLSKETKDVLRTSLQQILKNLA
jgi:DNA-binding MarR family transcriptional regulator